VLFGVMQITACTTSPQPKPLDLQTITGDIPIYSLNVIVRKDLDSDRIGDKFFKKFYIEELENILNILSAEGINCDKQTFFNEFNNSPNIGFEEIKITSYFILNRYFWNSPNKSETRIEFTLNLVINEDGSMPLTYTVKKDDPLYQPGYSASNTLRIINQKSN